MSRRALAFVALTFVLSFPVGFGFYALNLPAALGPFSALVLVGYMWIPALVAIVLQKAVYCQPLRDLGLRLRPNRWFFVAWLLPAVLALLTMGVSLLLPGVGFSWEMEGLYQRLAASLTPEQVEQMRVQQATIPIHPIWLGLVQALVAGLTINAVAAFGEEFGWRGFLFQELLPLGFWRSSALIGLIWGLWHAPIVWHGYNYPQHPGVVAVVMMTVWTVLMSPLFSWARLRAGSVIAPSLMHGSLNASYGLSIMLLVGGDDLTVGFTGVAGFVVFVVATAAIWAFDHQFVEQETMRAREASS